MDLHCPAKPKQTTWPIRVSEVLELECTNWQAGSHLQWVITHDQPHDLIIEVKLYETDQTEPKGTLLCSAMPGNPGWPTRFVIAWADLDGETVFLPRTPGRGKLTMFVDGIRPDKLQRMTLRLTEADGAPTCTISEAKISDGAITDWLIPQEPVVDALGQWMLQDWPGKCRDLDHLKANMQHLESAARPWPDHFSRFGGDKRVQLAATGWFRTGSYTHAGKDIVSLVDPDGHPFWSAGVDCVNPGVATEVVPGTEHLFAEIPAEDHPAAKELLRPGRWDPLNIDFGRWNLMRVYGDNWRQRWDQLIGALLRDAGFNSIGNWPSFETARATMTPYVIPLPAFPVGDTTLFRDLPDVFDPAWEASLEEWATFLQPFAKDQLLIGYFLSNEPQWGFGTFNLAAEMLARRPGSFSRQRMQAWLEDRYANEADFLQAWNTDNRQLVTGFADITSCELVDFTQDNQRAAQDCWDFGVLLVEQLIGATSRAAKAVAPNHLNLGNRWAWIASDLAYAGSEYLDVFSINCYGREPEVELIESIRANTGKPVMIGEWHFGALDRGPLGSGLQAVPTQADRGLAYRQFLETAAAIPGLVGAHWFQLYDQAPLGRFDGENWNIGLLDICSQPYPELIAAARHSHERLYEFANGSLAPVKERAPLAAKIAN